MVPKLPCVTLDSPGKSTDEFDLSDIIELLQNYLLSSSVEQSFFLGAE